MKAVKTWLPSILAAASLCACASLAGSLGVPVGQENAEYKVEGAGGVVAQVKPGNAAESGYRYGFTVLLKQAPKVASVKVERISGGRAETVIDDSRNPTVKSSWQPQQPAGAQTYLSGKKPGSVTWVGQTAELDMTEKNAPWLYVSGNTRQHYRITIRDLAGRETVFEQPTIIPTQAKQVYRDMLNIKR
ncbi:MULTISPECIES: hypothetical protein [Neisseria]|uniref:Lipoprotein n=1 Tax=Neisseria musculi TaxID=1815583 RepID=A0A7H1M8K7_9NEIS|nr:MULTISPECIES: hypothetical protein [Neisseria]MBF0804839.1 hypothetical protein [Neisseria sp. 19428wB4_WF04]QNT57972.1 hypothetical protein H7A79_2183 [Neisseria musculi]TFU39452.1 hypothetical protein E4T99_11015 [Neisseria sp. WF04]